MGDLVLDGKDNWKGRWREVFGNERPIHVELGTGKGGFLSEMAERYREEVNYIGIEAHQDLLYHAACQARERNVANVRFVVFDAANLAELFASGEVQRLYLNFSDPWPKNRHAKRRLTDSRFIEIYRQVVPPGGQLFFKTDNEPLFDYSLEQFAVNGLQLSHITRDLHNSDFVGNVMTEYERKFSSRGIKICRCEAAFPDETGNEDEK